MPSARWQPSLTKADWQHGGFGLYLHWPFCHAKCPYCDFNSYVSARIDPSLWKDAYLFEIARTGSETPGRMLNSVFFGGGTPSLMNPDIVAAVIDHIRVTWPVSDDLEITLEANPTSVEAGRFAAYRQAGVTRVSMGIQALNDTDLKHLGRLHTAEEALCAFDVARTAFDQVSFDLIYARQHQTVADWRAELRTALALAIDHLSLYQLIIEDDTAFGARYRQGHLQGLPSDDLGADLFQVTQEECAAAGFPAYEVSNHAADTTRSRHNMIYWRYGDYIGIGPGAHGRLTLEGQRYATETELVPQLWLERVRTAGSGETIRKALTTENQAREYLMMSLRLSEGTDIDRFARLGGKLPDQAQITELINGGRVIQEGSRLRPTTEGRLVLNAILRELLAN
ncbi:MAG: coproporphyrinogen III oxidase [Rhodobacteraceae bacterium]|nr:coproporphyrinogen III oxidase [Paracoccaceae bacterium]